MAFLTLLVAACARNSSGGDSTGSSTGSGNENNDDGATGATVDFNTNFVHPMGRLVVSSAGGALASWPGSGVKVRVTNASYVTADIAPREHGSYNIVGVLIDNKFSQTLNLINLYGPATFKIAVPDKGDHTVAFIKRTEAGDGHILFSKFTTDGTFQHQFNPNRTIEIIGENATAGYSVEGPAGVFSGTSCQSDSYDAADYIANPNFENAADTYGAQAAANFGADYSIVAATSRGLIQNYDGSNGDTMPILWPLLDPSDYKTAATPAQIPDVVVINLGANDINYWLYNSNTTTADASGFVASYAAFLQSIHSAYPNAKIVATVGPTLSDYQTLPSNGQGLLTFITTQVQAAIAQAQSAGVNATFVAFTADTTDASCDYYPDLAGHTKMATTLSTAIAQATGWASGSTGTANPNALAQGQGPTSITGTFAALADPLADAGDPNSTGISTQEFPQCNVCSPSKSAQNVASCPNTIGVNEACQGYCHIPDAEVDAYTNNPPSSGNHSGLPAYILGENTTPVGRIHYLHSLEHGAIVIAYNCPNGCDADLATVRQVVANNVPNNPGEPNNALVAGNTWVILTQDPLMPAGTNFAALSWTWSYTFNTADAATLQCFIDQHVYYGRECTATTTTQRTDYASAGCSPLLDEYMSSVTQ